MASLYCLILVIWFVLDTQAATENKLKNVLFFAVDDLRPELGAYSMEVAL